MSSFTTLDAIVNEELTERGLPPHWYFQYLVLSASCLRQLYIRTLKIVNSCYIYLDAGKSGELPCDYSDFVGVFIPIGQMLKPIYERKNFTPFQNTDPANGQAITWGTEPAGAITTPAPYDASNYWMSYHYNGLGEPIGRYFGLDVVASNPNGFQIFKEQGRIQAQETIQTNCLILQYVPTGMTPDNASLIDTRAVAAIKAYIGWKESRNRNDNRSPEARNYWNEEEKLRSALSDLTLDAVVQSLHSNYYTGPKT
jgi:hypothetical protein